MSYGPGAGPAPRALQDTELADLLARQRFGALATQKSSGRPHLSTVAYTWDPERQVVRISTIADRLKVRQLQRDPHGALYVASDDFRSYAVAEGEAELSPVSTEPGDEAGLELLAMQPNAPRDQEAFLRQMVHDRRMTIRLQVTRLYGTALDVTGEAASEPSPWPSPAAAPLQGLAGRPPW
ncbi:TIGR03618 family F420-dependent PPOX class oxidoreductase [Nonomuraea glycinis]|uniref:TIGR03618 family F420-dependent PPOX class oxidoreductase n=1 Tax=Nonomuraea glycinis TaxID=2047744 RepID=UPI002E1124D8|nr:TIGR03618 family F420-dependent PPOX class oxidoreductase [Nonomuraea glycinis]